MLNPTDFVRNCSAALYGALGLHVQEKGGFLYGSSGASAALLNGVMGGSFQKEDRDLPVVVDEIIRSFRDQRLPHSWWVEAALEPPRLKELLSGKELSLLGNFPGVLLLLKDFPGIQQRPELAIEPARDPKSLESWSEVIARAFGFDAQVSSQYLSLFAQIGTQGPLFHFVGKKEGKIVCTGSLCVTPQGGYLYNIATEESERRKGYGSQMTSFLVEFAKGQNLSRVALVSSPIGNSVYKKLDFKEITSFHLYADIA